MRKVPLDRLLFLSIPDLQRLFCINPGKALGEAGVGPDLFNAARLALGRFYHPLYFKTLACGIGPTLWSGGQFMALKKIPQPSRPTHMRDIRLEDTPPKKFESRLRKHAIGPAEPKQCKSTQFASGFGTFTSMCYTRCSYDARHVSCHTLH